MCFDCTCAFCCGCTSSALCKMQDVGDEVDCVHSATSSEGSTEEDDELQQERTLRRTVRTKCGNRSHPGVSMGDSCAYKDFKRFRNANPDLVLEYIDGIIFEKTGSTGHDAGRDDIREHLLKLFNRRQSACILNVQSAGHSSQ